jgi:hypothetical protein
MKSAHRHELQTNWLAQWLEVAIDRLRPYVSTIAGIILAIAVAMLIWSYMSRASATRQGDAWSAYNQTIGAASPNLEELHKSAQEYPGTQMQQLADITWADGQVFNASQSYIYNRQAAKASMERAVNAYNSILATSDDESLIDRAHLGLARVHEMRGDLEKARDEYLAIRGGYAAYGKAQAERLSKPEAKEAYAWLEKAVPPRVVPPTGPGQPGERPEFSAGDLTLPDSAMEPGAPGAEVPATSMNELLEGLGELPADSGKPGETEPVPPVSKEIPETPPSAPATEGADPATETAPPADVETTPAPSATESNEEKTGE